MRPKMIYFAYPYSEDPKTCTEEVKKLVKEILKIRTDLVPIIPHIAFDGIYDLPDGADHQHIAYWEYEIINRCDYICFPPTERFSFGCIWERQFARYVDTPVVDYFLLLEGNTFELCEKT